MQQYQNNIVVDIDNVLSCDIQTYRISKKLVFIISSRLSRLNSVLPSHMLIYIYLCEHYPTEN